METSRLIFFNRPRRFGKTLLMKLLWYLYLYGPDDEELKEKYPDLKIFDQEFGLNPKWKKIKENTYFPLYINFGSGKTYSSFEKFINVEIENSSLKKKIDLLTSKLSEMGKGKKEIVLILKAKLQRFTEYRSIVKELLDKHEKNDYGKNFNNLVDAIRTMTLFC